MTREIPKIFTAESVRAIMAGRKTQTRRVCLPTAYQKKYATEKFGECNSIELNRMAAIAQKISIGQGEYGTLGGPGDRFWVKESVGCYNTGYYDRPEMGVFYRADGENRHEVMRWHSPLFMEKKHCRLWLLIEDVRIEQLQDITDEDAWKEGCNRGLTDFHHHADSREWFSGHWDQINEKNGYTWESNPHVRVTTFSVMPQTETTLCPVYSDLQAKRFASVG